MRIWATIIMAATMLLTACEVPEEALSQQKPLPRIYRIPAGQHAAIQYRMLDAINTLRQISGADAMELNSRLNAAAATHSRDMALQNRPWHFGSDGSSPLDRIIRVGYEGAFLGETISETYETELETLSAWMSQEDTRGVILDTRANQIGFSWYQEPSGKIWWTLVTGQAVEVVDFGAVEDLLSESGG